MNTDVNKTSKLTYLFIILIIILILFSICLVYRFYITYKANQYKSPTYTPELASIVVFGYKLPQLILPQSIQGVNTESSVYTTIINNVLIVGGMLLGFYSLVAIETIKSTISYINDQKKRYNLTIIKLIKIAPSTILSTILSGILILILITSTYAILLVSIIDASHAAVYQGMVSTLACQIAITTEQKAMALNNITYSEINCQGTPMPLLYASSSPSFNRSIGTQLLNETTEIDKYEGRLFSNIKNAGNMLEGAILMLSLLLIAYAIIYGLKTS